jgi:hypothetical protein
MDGDGIDPEQRKGALNLGDRNQAKLMTYRNWIGETTN